MEPAQLQAKDVELRDTAVPGFLCKKFLEDHSWKCSKPSTQLGYQCVIDRCVIPVGLQKGSGCEAPRRFGADGKAVVQASEANKVFSILRKMFNLAISQGQTMPDSDPRKVMATHVRRLGTVRCAGIVEREAVELKSHQLIEWLARVICATRLDQQLSGGGKGLGDMGFGAEVKDALYQ